MSKRKEPVLTDEEIEAWVRKNWGKGYEVTILEIIRRKRYGVNIILYKVTCERDGATEWRCKGWSKVMGGWDYVTKRKF